MRNKREKEKHHLRRRNKREKEEREIERGGTRG